MPSICAAAPGAVPHEPQIRCEVTREEILVRRRKHRNTAAGGGERHGSIPRLNRHAFGLEAVERRVLQAAIGVVVGDGGAHVVAVLRPYIAGVLEGSPWLDELVLLVLALSQWQFMAVLQIQKGQTEFECQ